MTFENAFKQSCYTLLKISGLFANLKTARYMNYDKKKIEKNLKKDLVSHKSRGI